MEHIDPVRNLRPYYCKAICCNTLVTGQKQGFSQHKTLPRSTANFAVTHYTCFRLLSLMFSKWMDQPEERPPTISQILTPSVNGHLEDDKEGGERFD